MFRFEIKVEGLWKDGHPFSEYYMNEAVACKVYDQLVEQHPFHNVVLYQIERKKLKSHQKPVPAPTSCPRGHNGTKDGQSVIKQGSNGWNCTICGLIWA